MLIDYPIIKNKHIIILLKILQVILAIICTPFVLLFEGSSKIFYFLADLNQRCRDILVSTVSKTYNYMEDLVISFVNSIDKQNKIHRKDSIAKDILYERNNNDK